jgi:phosphoenolpyruvate synthase/pyruvate phosphate dikinase
MSPEYILPLADPRATIARVGGKGASLARLARAGLPVPNGFHITTDAYRHFVAENDVRASLRHAPTIGDVFARAPLSPTLADEIARAYLALGNLALEIPVAVRSSATAEDLAELSFAGQQESFLNIRGAAAVQAAVKRCWASLWTPRAREYRAQHAVAEDALALAVVVQELVEADAAGVMFTADPVSGQRDCIVINAAWGLGDAVVNGQVTPDTLSVDKASGRVIEYDVADKTVMTVCIEGGIATRATPAHLRRVAVLSDAHIAELARLGAQIERLYALPMDIEWVLARGRFAIVQARPITTLPNEKTQGRI